jgi:hypothetical protein
MLNIIDLELDIMLNGKKRRLEIMLNMINAEWDIMSNDKKCRETWWRTSAT